jgi:hypothetical protein
MLWIIVAILVILWLIGFIIHLGGAFIHILLVLALIIILVKLLGGRRNKN